MGGLLSRLQSDPNPVAVVVDFETCRPQTPEEERVYGQVEATLSLAPRILTSLEEYKGCGELIRKAINTPNEETQNEAWQGVLPMVQQLLEFYEFSLKIEQVVPLLLEHLCATPDAEKAMQDNQATTRQLASVFDFVLRFDDLKMTNPAIQNDFSYYRRTLNKMKMQNGGEIDAPIKDELANKMSLFYAYPTPMMKCLSETTVAFVSSNKAPRENVTSCFAMMANVCYSMVANKRFASNETNMFCLRAMTAAIIVYDHTDPQGAFHKKSPIHIKPAINTLKAFVPEKKTQTESLVNALRFTSIHLNDEETPNAVKNLLQ